MKYQCINDEGTCVAVISVMGSKVEIESDNDLLLEIADKPAIKRRAHDWADIEKEVKPGDEGYPEAVLDSLALMGYDVVELEERPK